jgi:hypothetical protein
MAGQALPPALRHTGNAQTEIVLGFACPKKKLKKPPQLRGGGLDPIRLLPRVQLLHKTGNINGG